MMSYGGGGGGGGGGSGGGGGGAAGGGGGEMPPLEPIPVGAFRFNPDTAKLEYWDGNQFVNVTTDSPEQNTGGTRGVIFGGYSVPGNGSNMIGHINISSTGNEVDGGGNLLADRYGVIGTSDRTRGLGFGGRNDPSPAASVDVIQFMTIASGNNAIDFGDLLAGQGHEQMAACSDSTRALVGGGYRNPNDGSTFFNIISFVTTQSLGDAIDFGDLTTARGAMAAASSPTRGLFIGGRTNPGNGSKVNTIDFVNISTTGNAADFGDQVTAASHHAGCSNAVRAITGLGYHGSDYSNRVNVIEYITIATLGDATDFGDLTRSNSTAAACASSTRGVFVGGGQASSPYGTTVMDYVQIMSTGNAVDFGDLIDNQSEANAAASNGHGGLG